jgi:hypothetical protein
MAVIDVRLVAGATFTSEPGDHVAVALNGDDAVSLEIA